MPQLLQLAKEAEATGANLIPRMQAFAPVASASQGSCKDERKLGIPAKPSISFQIDLCRCRRLQRACQTVRRSKNAHHDFWPNCVLATLRRADSKRQTQMDSMIDPVHIIRYFQQARPALFDCSLAASCHQWVSASKVCPSCVCEARELQG